MYSSGIRVYLLDNYNLLDFIVLSLYLASYMLRFLVDRWIKQADRHYNGTERAREAKNRRKTDSSSRSSTEETTHNVYVTMFMLYVT